MPGDTIPLTPELRRAIQDARRLAGLSLAALAREAQIGRSTLERLVSEKYDDRAEPAIAVRQLRAIARVTRQPIDWFLPPDQAAQIDGPDHEERIAALEREVRGLRAVVSTLASALSLEQLEADQRQFLQGWLRRSPSPSEEGGHGKANQGEG